MGVIAPSELIYLVEGLAVLCGCDIIAVVAKYVMDQYTETDHSEGKKTIKVNFDYTHIDDKEKVTCLERLAECGYVDITKLLKKYLSNVHYKMLASIDCIVKNVLIKVYVVNYIYILYI